VYRSWSGNRTIGGKMLKKLFCLLLLLLSFNALACWKVDGSFAVDGDTWKINNKFEHDKEYIFPMGTFILKLKIKPGKEKEKQTLLYTVHEKKGITLTLVTQGEEEGIKVGESRDVFAKGEEGQPNSIITVKLTNI
jgi:hypothetical protein